MLWTPIPDRFTYDKLEAKYLATFKQHPGKKVNLILMGFDRFLLKFDV